MSNKYRGTPKLGAIPFLDDETGFEEIPTAGSVRYSLAQTVAIRFNYRGKIKTVLPTGIRFGIAQKYVEPVWFMSGYDHDAGGAAEFVMAEMHDVLHA